MDVYECIRTRQTGGTPRKPMAEIAHSEKFGIAYG